MPSSERRWLAPTSIAKIKRFEATIRGSSMRPTAAFRWSGLLTIPTRPTSTISPTVSCGILPPDR